MVEEQRQVFRTSAWYAPGASVAYFDSILNDQKKMIACSVFC
jgi:hypothetical protein